MKVLSKSRFKLGLECPNKLYYTGKPTVFPNKKSSDTFLLALANGGFQVEELARLHYPGGIFIDAEPYEYQKAADLTKDALQQENVIIYEAAFLVDGYYVRTDVLVKQNRKIHLIEVKAKSINPTKEYIFKGKRGGLDADYKPYLYDLAFQKKVAQLAFSEFEFKASFMMADKTKVASIDGMNQLFRVPMGGDPRQGIDRRVNSLAEIGHSVLTEIDVDDIVEEIIDGKLPYSKELNFSDAKVKFRNAYRDNQHLNWQPDFKACKLCEFKASQEEKAKGLISGFEQCFIKKYQWTDKEFRQPSSMEIWNYRGTRSFPNGRILMKDLIEGDVKGDNETRQLLQVEKAVNNDMSFDLNKDGLKAEMNLWVFPLHMIDFETSTVALPFFAGRHPYEQVAFQFSHHIIHANGRVEHADEFISNTPGEFPNFHFVRALKRALECDNGTIFRFASHENTILNAVIDQLKVSNEVDKNALIDFMKSITVSKEDSADKWIGDRKMVDLKDVVFKYYYNPYTKGSNSIKAVLPAVLKSSAFLQAKYSQNIGQAGVSSANFSSEHIWLTKEKGEVVNPYKMLPPLFEGWAESELEDNVSEIDGIADGGMALTAYAKLQYQDMTDKERTEITGGLLKYCELDTLAMVMIYEHFTEICS
jgi:hypothetical protein